MAKSIERNDKYVNVSSVARAGVKLSITEAANAQLRTHSISEIIILDKPDCIRCFFTVSQEQKLIQMEVSFVPQSLATHILERHFGGVAVPGLVLVNLTGCILDGTSVPVEKTEMLERMLTKEPLHKEDCFGCMLVPKDGTAVENNTTLPTIADFLSQCVSKAHNVAGKQMQQLLRQSHELMRELGDSTQLFLPLRSK